MDWRNVGEQIEGTEALDQVVRPAHRLVTSALPKGPAKDLLHGVWLGHPLHPLLTDLPIGFWTSAWTLDLIGGKRSRPAADLLVGLGVLAALPTAASGVADWSELNDPERRTGLVHAVANLAATGLYALSLVQRLRGKRFAGVALGMAGAGAATVGGFLGGHLSFRRGAGVNHAADAPSATSWRSVVVDGAITRAKPTLGHLDDEPLVAFDDGDGPVALFDRCSHLGGPLHEGDLTDGCVRCPWHGSVFRGDGSVVHGPATAAQPAYDMRVSSGQPEVRGRPPV
jgi:nitrite reductase/ring-hydroxylating ferredoxin subunit/uncharacterized membrane protein